MKRIEKLWFDGGRIYVQLTDGMIYNRPLEAFPTLMDASKEERENYEINRYGDAVRWHNIDEDIHMNSFLEVKEPDRNNETSKLLSRFPWIDLGILAKEMKIHKSVLMSYIYGMQQPPPERMTLLRDTLHVMGGKMLTA